MKIIKENLTHCEPLIMRFVFESEPSESRKKELAEFAVHWMAAEEEKNPQEWYYCEFGYRLEVDEGNNVVEVTCELMPECHVEPLAMAVAERFTDVKLLKLGDPYINKPSLDIEWLEVPAGECIITGERYDLPAFTIAFTPITLGQFRQFLKESGYSSKTDTLGVSDTISTQVNSFGDDPHIPLFGVQHHQALAYCEWSGHRLPTNPESRRFFDYVCDRPDLQFEWSGVNWTSTPAGPDSFIARNGPYQSLGPDDEDTSFKPLHKHHCDGIDAPCFRVVKRS
ncbi:MAG: hypothetical protein CMJ46_13955 [Planctomyces sp.]|nr:hypothetical protein [Planctomyces sp.]